MKTYRIFLLLSFVCPIVVGCGDSDSENGGRQDDRSHNQPDTPDTDEEKIRQCVEGWLTEQRMDKNGEKYWDEYVTTPIDAPNLSEYARVRRDLEQAAERVQPLLGETVVPQRTIEQVSKLNAVRSWEILNVELTDFNAKRKSFTQREKRAKTSVRIESSRLDGTPIVQTWTILLYKNEGKWGIFFVTDGT